MALETLRGEFFTNLLDADFMISVGYIISSPHIQIDPAVRLVYYNLLFHGYVVGGFETQNTARTSYLQCLRFLEHWQETATGTTMDLIAASLTTWTAIQNFDYDLAWEMHSLTCGFVKSMDLHLLDSARTPSQEATGEEYRNKQRLGFWVTLVVVDIYFQLCLDRPSCISAEASTEHIHLPSFGDITSERPLARTYSTYFVWIRLIFIGKTFLEGLSREDICSLPDFQKMVDGFCDEILLMIEDWRLVSKFYVRKIGLMELQVENVSAHKDDRLQSYMYSECLVAAITMILQMDKLRQLSPTGSISSRSLVAARMLVDAIVAFDNTAGPSVQHEGLSMYNVAFWSFRGFFALYYHILNCHDTNDHHADLYRLEQIAATCTKAAKARFEYGPIAKAIVSLNRFARNFEKARRTASANSMDAACLSQGQDMAYLGLTTIDQPPSSHSETGWDGMQFFQHWGPISGDMQLDSTAAGRQQVTAQTEFEPTSYVQAVERQFLGSLWNYGWWDANISMHLP